MIIVNKNNYYITMSHELEHLKLQINRIEQEFFAIQQIFKYIIVMLVYYHTKCVIYL